MAASIVEPDQYVALRLNSGHHRIIKAVPDSTLSLVKYGSIPANLIIGRPYYITYELLDGNKNEPSTRLRIVPASELHAEAVADSSGAQDDEEDVDIVEEDGQVMVRNNRLTVDDPSRQALSSKEIEDLKQSATGSGREIVDKIMQSHSAIDEKTAFSLAKYTLRKTRKYLRRFTVLPIDVNILAKWFLLEKEPTRVMEMREETLGLMLSWANVHCHGADTLKVPGGRYLVVDEAGGIVVASMAERMGLLSASEAAKTASIQTATEERLHMRELAATEPADTNSITLIHPATQPNLSVLEYFNFDSANPDPRHQLYTRLHTLSLLQLAEPHESTIYASEPASLTEDELSKLKSNRRGNYYRKRRRWERTKKMVDDTRAGGFDSLVIATYMELPSLMHLLVPLVKGGGQVVVYSTYMEPLTELCDLYSSARRVAYLGLLASPTADEEALTIPNRDFPVDPRMLLAPTLQTVRATQWQVLPGRTHPLMTSFGGPEGYVFTATRAVPHQGKVEARGNFSKRKPANTNGSSGIATPSDDPDEAVQ